MLTEKALQTLALLQAAKQDMNKATFAVPANATSGLQLYDLETPAKTLIPVYLVLLKSTPRSGGGKSIQANWQVITGQNTGNLTAGVPEGKRNGILSFSTSRNNAVYKTLSMEGSSTLQATLAASGLIDLRGEARQMGLNSLFLEQERVMFGGNTTSTGIALGTGPTPVVTLSAGTGGTVSAAMYCRIIPLTVEGVRQATTGASGAVATTRSVTPADGSSAYTVNLGNGAISAEGNITGQAGTTNIMKLTWAAVKGAAGYAVYAGTATGAANQFLQTIVYTTTTTLGTTALLGASQAANATGLNVDNSQDQYVYDGMYTQTIASFNAGTGGYYLSLNPTGVAAGTLTADGKGGIAEFDTFLIDRFNTYKFTEFEIHVGGNQLNNIKNKIRTGTTSSPFMITVQDGKPDITGGSHAVAYVHPLTAKLIPLILNPNVPDGTIFFKGTQLPSWFLNTNISTVWEVGERLSYMSMDWPLVSWEYKSAVLADEVLKGYVPFGNGVLGDVALG